MQDIIFITQSIKQTGDAAYKVYIEIEGEKHEFEYSDCNGIYPLYNSLIKSIDELEDVHIELETSDKRFAHEVMGNPNKNARMLEILKNIQERQNITIDAF